MDMMDTYAWKREKRPKEVPPPRHQAVYVWMVIATWVVLLATFFFNGISTLDLNLGIYTNSMLFDTNNFELDITPASWTFSIWGFIYTYQVIWVIYATANLFRRGDDGRRLYNVARFLHWTFFVSYMINLISTIAWLLLFDRQLIIPSLIALVVSVITIVYCGASSIYGIYKYYPDLCEQGFRIENRLVLGIVTNGIGMYGAWLTVATHLNLGFVLIYRAGLSQATGSAIPIALLTFLLALYWVLDIGVLEKYNRFLFTPYIVFPVAFIGIWVKSFNGENPTMIYITMLLLTSIAMLVLKILVGHRNQRLKPAFPECPEKVETETVILYT